jgi:hypothetical protein
MPASLALDAHGFEAHDAGAGEEAVDTVAVSAKN